MARWHRAIATLLALWLPFVVGEPALAYACPMHTTMAMQHAMPHRHDTAPPRKNESRCVCIGCSAPAVATTGPIASLVTIVVAWSRDPGATSARHAPPADIGLLLGLYTTGPPAVALAL